MNAIAVTHLRRRSCCLCAIGALLLVSPEVQAQTTGTSPRPYRGVYGGSNETSLAGGGLDVTLSVLQGYDGDITGQSGPRPTTQPTVGGRYTSGSADVSYQRIGAHLGVSASANVGARQYPQLDGLLGKSYGGSLGMSVSGGGFRAALSQSGAFSPFYSFHVLPAAAAAGRSSDPTPAVNITTRESTAYNTQVTVSQQLGGRTNLGGSIGLRTTNFARANTPTANSDLSHRSGSVQISRNFTRYLGLSVGYGLQEGAYSSVARRSVRTHDLNIGTNYNRPLSATRRTFLTFSTGTSIVEEPARRAFHLTGAAGLRHQMGRSWSALLDYDRGVRYVEGFADPFLSDSISGTLSGLASRRANVNLQVGYSTGLVGLASDAPAYTTYFGNAGVDLGLTRLLAVRANYFYYQYAFERASATIDLPRQFDRHGVSVGLALWIPVIR